MPAPAASRKPMNFGRLLLLCMMLGLVAGGLAAAVSALELAEAPLINAATIMVMGVPMLRLCRTWWLSVDEGVREAHKFSWFWGGSVALIPVGAVALALVAIADGETSQYGLTPREAGMVLAGIAFSVTALLVGYGVCWAAWWRLRSR